MIEKFDYIIAGAGIIGLATGYELSKKFPNKKILILEKENKIASHQTGRNSGVIHSGIYYKPNSLKAINCREGKILLEEFCKREKVNFEICGKVIVAVEEKEIPMLHSILARGIENKVKCKLIDKSQLNKLEPFVNGKEAIFVEETGIVDYVDFCEKLKSKILEKNQIHLNEKVTKVSNKNSEVIIQTNKNEYIANQFINSAGIYSDKIIKSDGTKIDFQMIPFRGEYFQLTKEAESLCKNLIYPVPNPEFPFLGVHFTRMIQGGVECGPNAVLALGKESYSKFEISILEVLEYLYFKGFWKMASKYWKTGLGELWRSISKPAFVKALQRLIPEIQSKNLIPIEAGIRAQAVNADGFLLDDFLILKKENLIHIGNAPSPAATSSLNIAKTVVEKYL